MASASQLSCNLGKDERTIEVKKVEAGCKVVYTKMGQGNDVAKGSKGTGHCESVLKKIAGNLKSAGFTCK